MITRQQADELERLMGQMEGMHSEVTALNKKAPHDAVNQFKLGFINATIDRANQLLGKDYRPLGDFVAFSPDMLPTNSDVTFVLAQYSEALEKLRSDNVKWRSNRWCYDILDNKEEMHAAPPANVRKK